MIEVYEFEKRRDNLVSFEVSYRVRHRFFDSVNNMIAFISNIQQQKRLIILFKNIQIVNQMFKDLQAILRFIQVDGLFI